MFRDLLPDWLYDTPELLSHAYDQLAAHERDQAGPRCLVHGDSHQGNSFLRADGQRIWTDWQLARRGTPWSDSTYFIVGALTVDERRTAADDCGTIGLLTDGRQPLREVTLGERAVPLMLGLKDGD